MVRCGVGLRETFKKAPVDSMPLWQLIPGFSHPAFCCRQSLSSAVGQRTEGRYHELDARQKPTVARPSESETHLGRINKADLVLIDGERESFARDLSHHSRDKAAEAECKLDVRSLLTSFEHDPKRLPGRFCVLLRPLVWHHVVDRN